MADVYTPAVTPKAGIHAYGTAGTSITWGGLTFGGVTDLEVNFGSAQVVRVFSDKSLLLTGYAEPLLTEHVYLGTRSHPTVSFTGLHSWVDEGSIGQRHLMRVNTSIGGAIVRQAILIDASRAGSVNDVWKWSVVFQLTQDSA